VCHPVVVVRGNGDHGRHQLRGRFHHHRPRRISQIRCPPKRESTVEPGLLSQPGDCVSPVSNLLAERFEVPTRAGSASATLVYDVIAVGREVARGEVGDQTGAAVRSAYKYRAQRPSLGCVDVGQKFDIVTHWDTHLGHGVVVPTRFHPEDPNNRGAERMPPKSLQPRCHAASLMDTPSMLSRLVMHSPPKCSRITP